MIVGNSAGEVGDIILANSTLVAIDGLLTVTGYEESTVGETATRYFTKEFRYSIDGAAMGAWLDLTDPANFPIILENIVSISIELKYTRAGADATGWIYYNSARLIAPFYVDRRSTIQKLFERFYPKGWAFKIPFDGIRAKVNEALALSENRAYSDAVLTNSSLLPDSKYFGTEDADIWEQRLGLINGTGLSIATRRENILRKYAFPGTIIARQNYRYIERELQAAGFDVYVHENRFPDGGGGFETKTYQQFVDYEGFSVYGAAMGYGFMCYGETKDFRVVNYLDAGLDDSFDFDNNLERTFFIGGSVAGTYADVLLAREEEFRKLILTLKPVQTGAYLVINYI